MSTIIELYVIAGIVGSSLISASLFYGIPYCRKRIADRKSKKAEKAKNAARALQIAEDVKKDRLAEACGAGESSGASEAESQRSPDSQAHTEGAAGEDDRRPLLRK